MSSAPNAASTQNITMRSSSDVRLITNSRPSTAIRPPARQPSAVERSSRRPIRHSISTASVPSSAVMNRQPNGLSPKTHSPSEMTHLPTGGCTTYEGSALSGICCGCWRISVLALSGQLPS